MIGNDWDEKLSIIWHSNGFKKFLKIVEHEYETKTIYPPKNYIFNALKLTPYANTTFSNFYLELMSYRNRHNL